jgi:hypothetical protein
VLAAVFVIMSWFSRAGSSWGAGRFSPFGRPGNNANTEVTDDNYSYITKEDLENATSKGRHRSGSRNAAPEIVDWADNDPNRETDVLVFKHGRTNYPTHFAAQSIRDGDLTIGTVRQAAAKKMGVNDPKRIRMFFKGRNLKHDDRTAREEGLRGDGNGSEILCVVGEGGAGSMAPGSEETGAQKAWSDGSDEEDDTEAGDDSGVNAASKKKRRNRGGRKNKKKGSGTSTPAMGYSNAGPTPAEFLPTPTNFSGPRPTPSPQSAPPPATPQTAIGKMDALASKFHTEFVPLCIQYLQNPPEDKAKRQFEYKKLSETILAQILLKLDGVETEGDPDARVRRKELVREVQNMLNKLDEVVK